MREGNDLHVSVSVPMTGAALGSKVKIETLDGEIEIEIKPGTQSGSVLPIRGKGITKLRGSGRGDLFAHIDVLIPNKLSKKKKIYSTNLQRPVVIRQIGAKLSNGTKLDFW